MNPSFEGSPNAGWASASVPPGPAVIIAWKS